MSTIDEEKLKTFSVHFRDLAELIINREQALQKLHDFSIFDTDSARFWGSSKVFNPMRFAQTRENLLKEIGKSEGKIEKLIESVEKTMKVRD